MFEFTAFSEAFRSRSFSSGPNRAVCVVEKCLERKIEGDRKNEVTEITRWEILSSDSQHTARHGDPLSARWRLRHPTQASTRKIKVTYLVESEFPLKIALGMRSESNTATLLE